jgi:hypothetical protein
MAVLPIHDLALLRPDWCALHEAALLRLEPGDHEDLHFHDCGEYLLVTQGRLTVDLAGRHVTVEAGEMLLAATGKPHAIVLVHEPTTALLLRDDRQAPFRDEVPVAAAKPGVLLPPKAPAPAPGRRAHTVTYDPSHTFSPASLRPGDGDVLLRVQPGDLSRRQADEIRATCDAARQCIAFLAFETRPRAIDAWFFDTNSAGNVARLDPAHLAVPLDPLAEDAAALLARYEQHWQPRLAPRDRALCLEFALRVLGEAELARLVAFFAELPPARWGILLHWDGEVLGKANAPTRGLLAALRPWLRGVVCPRDATRETAMQLEGFGWQGWICEQ